MMIKKNIVIINGESGCGKSRIIRRLAKMFSAYSRYSTGDAVRAMAAEAGVSIEEFNAYNAKYGLSFDEKIDNKLKEIGERENFYLIDSRLGACFIPHSFKVLVKIQKEVAAKRRWLQLTKQDPEKYRNLTVEEVLRDLIKRDEENQERYTAKYGFCILDESQYDLVIENNEDNNDEEIFELICTAYVTWLKVPCFQD